MTAVIYIGPFLEGVEIAETGQWAPHGEPVDVDVDLAARLLEQPGNWQAKGKPSPAAGNTAEVLARVGGDPAKAAAALTEERGRAKPRKTLVAALEEIAGVSDEPPATGGDDNEGK